MDDTHREISFDASGVCNFCRSYVAKHSRRKPAKDLKTMVAEIRQEGRGKAYDCLLAISGGLDSSYLAYLAVQHGLRPLAFHLDNGWNTELAVKNIELLCRKLDIDLHTHVIDWAEFRDLQIGFLKSSLANLEGLTDHAIFAGMRHTAARLGIRTILTGVNEATEQIVVPESYGHAHSDGRLILSVHRKFCELPLKTFPVETFLSRWWHRKLSRTREVTLLNLAPYRKQEAEQLLEQSLGWKRYPGKHGESVFTRFFQATFIPRKLGLDKRKIHLSDLICSGQLRREEALVTLKQPPYPIELIAADRDFVCKKLGLSFKEMEEFLRAPPNSHRQFTNDEKWEAVYDRISSAWLGFRDKIRNSAAGVKA